MVEPAEIVTLAENARDTWDTVARSLKDISFDFESPHPSLGSSLEEFSRGLSLALELGASSNLNMDSDLVSMLNAAPAFVGMRDATEQIRVGAQGILDFIDAAVQQQSSVQVVNPNTLKDASNRQLNLAQQLKQIKNAAAQYVSHLALLQDFLLQAEMSDLASRIKRFRNAGTKLEKLLADSESSSEQLSSHRNEAKSSLETIKAQLDEIEQSRGRVQEVQSAAAQILNEADSKLSNIRETAAQSDTLREKVEQYESQFEAFDDALEKRLEKLANFEASVEKARIDNKKREEEIDRITAKANQMLQGATNAGLAKSFKDASDEYKQSAATAKNSFYLSIVFLAISAIPLASYVFPIPFLDSVMTVERGSITLGGIFARAVLLLPTIWLTTFAAHRYMDLFQLHREYSFKAAIAMSVEGFKQQAPKYEEEIAGATFVELSQKPEYGPTKDNVKNPNPVMAFWIKSMQKRFDSLSGSE